MSVNAAFYYAALMVRIVSLCAEAGGGQEFKVSSCHNEAEHDRCRAFAEVTGPRVVVQSRWCPICVWIIFDFIIFITHMFRCAVIKHTHTLWKILRSSK